MRALGQPGAGPAEGVLRIKVEGPDFPVVPEGGQIPLIDLEELGLR